MRNILIPRGIVSPALAWAPPPPGELLMEGVSEGSWGPPSTAPLGGLVQQLVLQRELFPPAAWGTSFGSSRRARACGKRGTTSAGLISIKYKLMASSGPGTVLAAGDTGMNTVGVAPRETRHPAHTYSHHQNRPRWKQSSAHFNNNGHSGNRKGCRLLSTSSLPGTEHFMYVNSF